MALFKALDTRRFGQRAAVSGSATVTDNEDTIATNAVYVQTANSTVTLRDATTNPHGVVTVLNDAAHGSNVIVSVAPSGSQTIGGSASAVQLAPKQAIRVVSDGADWRILDYPRNARRIVGRTTAYAVLKEDLFNRNVITADGTFTVTLLSASSVKTGDSVTIKNTGSGSISIATTSSQTIDGAAGPLVLAAQERATLVAVGGNWSRIG